MSFLTYEIKRAAQDFIVEEITPDKKVLELEKTYKFDEKSSGNQLICVLEKNNWDTHLAIRKIAERLHVSRSRIGFAGMKDKRAITTQRVSLWNIKPNVTDFLKIRDIIIKPLYYSEKRIELGDLWGNRFTIRVFTRKKLGKVPKKIPNFFGEQRFGGGGRQITHLVGREIVREDLEKAVKIYLTQTTPSEREETQKARRKLSRSKDYKAALTYFPFHLKFERTLIAHLAEHPNDYAGALRALPKFLKIMFVHAYQAQLFNEFLEQAIKKKLKYKTGPLFGYETPPKNALEEAVLKKQKLAPNAFKISCLPEASSRGERRNLWVELKGFKIAAKEKGAYVVRFSLPKGSYATTAIDTIFK